MKLFLEKLTLINFGGQTQTFEFGNVTDVIGPNGAGKTRLKDAFSWLLTDRDSNNSAKFDIKDYIKTENNRSPHTVIGDFKKKDGTLLTLQKDYLEKWGSDKGDASERLKGHTTDYFINGNAKAEKDYNEYIRALIPQSILLVLTDPLYFPKKLNWQDQRTILAQMAGELTNTDVVYHMDQQGKNVDKLNEILSGGDTIEEKINRVSYEIKKAKEVKDKIRPAIEENTNTINSFPVYVPAVIQAKINELNGKLDEIEAAITDKVDAETLQSNTTRDKRNSLNHIKEAQLEIERLARVAVTQETNTRNEKVSLLKDKIAGLITKRDSKNNLVNSHATAKLKLDGEMAELIKNFNTVNAKVYPKWDDDNFICPKCLRKHEADKVAETEETLKAEFLEKKRTDLLEINKTGNRIEKDLESNALVSKSAKTELETINTELTQAETDLKNLEAELEGKEAIKTAVERLAVDKVYNGNKVTITNLEAELAEVKKVDYEELKQQKLTINAKIKTEEAKQHTFTTIKQLNDRNKELADKEKSLGQQIADLQNEEFLLSDFVISRMDLIEIKVREHFQNVKFVMFDKNIDGTMKPYCEAWLDGKPFSALNTAAQLNAGLDILNGLSKYYGVFLPILLDNREGVTDIIPVESQVINLQVGGEKGQGLKLNIIE